MLEAKFTPVRSNRSWCWSEMSVVFCSSESSLSDRLHLLDSRPPSSSSSSSAADLWRTQEGRSLNQEDSVTVRTVIRGLLSLLRTSDRPWTTVLVPPCHSFTGQFVDTSWITRNHVHATFKHHHHGRVTWPCGRRPCPVAPWRACTNHLPPNSTCSDAELSC